ncbi:alpha-L-rhamnosidase-related protein [Saccharicrinis sp. GN24d3]|uniref:alpha-L-rhamnosidase-related protein n=1 Tax=Saccharicrinis sp. GN24d3 TaxID=3458416 RepID=UPI0040372B0E
MKQLLLIIACCLQFQGFSQIALPPTALRCDLMKNTDRVFINGELSQIAFDEVDKIIEPSQLASIESRQPVFSWIIEDQRNNTMQTHFHVQIGTSPGQLDDKEGVVWDSGKTASQKSLVKYDGMPLKPETNYYWRVKVWNNHGEETAWSETRGFRTGKELKVYSSGVYPLQQRDEYPQCTKKIKENLQFIDFGKAAFGRVKLTVDSKLKEDSLLVSFGEVVTPQGRINTEPGGSRRYRTVTLALLQGIHTYTITIKKDKRNTRSAAIKMPDYTGDVFPFRYCEVEGAANITGIIRETVTYPFNDYSSHFECSNPVLNDIWDFCKYSIKATSFAGIYVDGDRERIPYEADAYINQLCHYGVDDDFTQARRSQEYMLLNPTWPTEWILSSVLMAWKDYQYTGNEDFIRKYYNDLKQKTFTSLTEKNGLISTRTGKLTKEVQKSIHFTGRNMRDIVDWPHKGILGLSNDDSGETDGFVFTDYNAVVNAYHNKALQVMAVIADIVGEEEDSKYYADRAKEHKKAFNKLFFNQQKGCYNDGIDTDHNSLHSNMFALTFGLVPEEHVLTVTDFVESRGMACSVYGSQHLLDAVYAGENAAYGMELLTATHDRGWAHAIYEVGTTISLEAWDNKYKPNQDWNHAWGAAPANVIPMKLMGIEPLEPGFERIRIKPQPANLEWANMVHPTIKGDVKLSFENVRGESFTMKVELPANTKNEVWIPYSGKGKYSLSMNGERISAKRIRDFIVVENIGSGKYVFELDL